MAENVQDPQSGDPGSGPGSEYVDPNGIILLGLYLAIVTSGLLVGLWSVWPSCGGERPPTVTAVIPKSGPTAGGTQVTITGFGFTHDSLPSFGGVAAADVSVSGTSVIRALTPQHLPGKVDVQIQRECGGATVWQPGFTYTADASNASSTTRQPAGALTIRPAAGPIAGDTRVTVQGASFADGDKVTFGGADAKETSFDAATGTLMAVSPQHALGKVDVVAVRKGTPIQATPGAYAYFDQMTLSRIEPASGSILGCDTATITGSGFVEGMDVTFGVVPAPAVVVNSPTSLTVLTPIHASGKVDVVARLGSSARMAGGYNYTCPAPADRVLFFMVILAGALGAVLHAMRSFFMYVGVRKLVQSWVWMYLLLPLAGAAVAVVFYIIVGAGLFTLAGGEPGFTIIGLGALVGMFSAQAVEKLKGIAEGIFSKAPAGSEHLTEAVPAITGVKPSEGGAGIAVEIAGSGFAPGLTIAFGGVAATEVVVVSDKKVTAKTPQHAAGAVDVIVTVDGKPPAKLASGFTYK
jgi:hypothetical protein